MHFSLSDEQKMIRDSVNALLAAQSDSAAVRGAMASDSGIDHALWSALSQEMCCCAIAIPEAYGGLGLGQVELAIVEEEIGRHVACVPFHATASLAVNALLLAGSDTQKQRWLPGIAGGDTIATLAGAHFARQHGTGSARWQRDGDGYRLDGHFPLVSHAHIADLIIVAAGSETGTALFAVPAGTAGLSAQKRATMDQTRAQGALTLNAVWLPESARLAQGTADVLENILSRAVIALAAEELGVAEAALQMAVAYTGERRQFGREIASFQAIKHRAADMMLKCELARSAVYYAACVADASNVDDRNSAGALHDAASLAKAYVSEAAFFNAGSAIQLMGGVGFTWEYDAHLYFKRAQSGSALLGSPALHRARIANSLLGAEEFAA
ncbi:acyl-CoA dehydrogenase family protein [Craterilacuibacter sinensis]|uniref:Acyl-CoA dehydrogenase n=1 Tax=Craterilacuibacter sinensis TaxID=2686017 RepID=A0A845BQS9_9NEIS|nr:acyl-CoA dehydrogenase family protein [Craterilacuibacter sinensis]MXR37518.1 acyl-CoA dehydrogenase [Craterilacuibacter sinensis]